MNTILGAILIIGVVVFLIYNIFGLVKDIKKRKHVKNDSGQDPPK